MSEEILIFYSSETEPGILDYYGESISYLKQMKKKVKIIDIFKTPGPAKENNILATPTLLVKEGAKKKEFFGIVDGMKEILRKDLFGKTLIHGMSYKEGRDFAASYGIHEKKKKGIEEKITIKLKGKISGLKIFKFDKRNAKAEIKIEYPSENSKERYSTDVHAFLGGVFMEVFGKTVYSELKRSKENIEEIIIE